MDPYEDLSDDNHIAFMQLEKEFRREFESAMEEPNASWEWYAPDYMNKVLAAANALGISELQIYDVPKGRSLLHENFVNFQRDVDNIIVQMRINNARRMGEFKVGLTSAQKSKLHTLISKMREEVENSAASADKKDNIFRILGELGTEIDRDRTNYQRFADLARSLAGLSREVAEEGAEPWWKWFKLAAGVVDEAKEAEPSLPSPAKRKALEPPRKQLPKPAAEPTHSDRRAGYGNPSSSSDDEIPF